MNILNSIMSPELTEALGWTLLHSLWQGAAIAILISLTLIFLSKHSANTRYWISLSGLIILFISTISTFNYLYEPPAFHEPAAIELSEANLSNIPPAQMDFTVANSIQSYPTDYLNYFQPHLPLFVSIWLLGILLFGLKMLGEFAYLQHLKNHRCHLLPRSWQERTHEMAVQMGIKKVVFVKETYRIHSPMVIGFFKPIILFPIGILNQLSVEQVESIIAHELAHVRRNDYLINLFMTFAEVLLFFNPFVWWINRRIRIEREFSCDDLAIDYTGDTLSFIKSLAQLEEWRMSGNSLAMAFGGSKKGVLARVQRIVQPVNRQSAPARAFLSVVLLCICLAAVAFQPATERDSIPPVVEVPEIPTPLITEHAEEPSSNLEEVEIDSDPQIDALTVVHSSPNVAPEPELLPVSIQLDSVPKEMEALYQAYDKLDKQRNQLEAQLNQKERAFEKQVLQLEKQIQDQVFSQKEAVQKLEIEMQKQEHVYEKIEHEFETQERILREQRLDLEHKAEELEIQRETLENQEDINTQERRAQMQSLQEKQRALLQQESQFREQELMLEKEMHQRAVDVERIARDIEHRHFEMAHQLEMTMHEFEIQRQQIEHAREVAEAEMEIQVQELEIQMEEIDQQLEALESELEEEGDEQ